VQLELRKPLRAQRNQAAVVRPGPNVGEVHLIAPPHQQLHPENAATAKRVDDTRRDRLRRRVKGGGRHLLRLPGLQHVAVAWR